MPELRAGGQCPLSAEGRNDRGKRGRGEAQAPGPLWKRSVIDANTIHLRDGSQAGPDLDTDDDTEPFFQKAGCKTALSCGQRSQEKAGLPESVKLTSEVRPPVFEPRAGGLG